MMAIPACSAAGTEKTARSQESTNSILLEGRIDAASLKDLKRKLSAQTKRLVVSSAGGRGPEAIELGSLVRSRNLEVVVDGICLSACAHFVFLPARKKHVEPNSVVAFHHTTTAMADVLIASGRLDLAAAYLPFAKQEQDFYKAAGISRRALEDPFQKILPLCYQEIEEMPVDSEYRTFTFTKFTFYIPALADLYAQGVGEITGYWPTAPIDVERAMSRYPKRLNATVKMKLTTSRDVPYAAVAVPACPDEPAYSVTVKARHSR